MIRVAPTPCSQSLARVKAWLASAPESRLKIAKAAGVDEKTLRDAAEKPAWNPTVKTLQKLEAVVPRDWQPPPNGRNGKNGKRRAS